MYSEKILRATLEAYFEESKRKPRIIKEEAIKFMGIYTELILKVRVHRELPKEVEEVLQYLFAEGERPEKLPDHEFFLLKNWTYIGNSSSYYHIPKSFSHYEMGCLFTRFDLKNYDYEIEKFIDWIDDYIINESGSVIGWQWYEGSEEPTLLRKKEAMKKFEQTGDMAQTTGCCRNDMGAVFDRLRCIERYLEHELPKIMVEKPESPTISSSCSTNKCWYSWRSRIPDIGRTILFETDKMCDQSGHVTEIHEIRTAQGRNLKFKIKPGPVDWDNCYELKELVCWRYDE